MDKDEYNKTVLLIDMLAASYAAMRYNKSFIRADMGGLNEKSDCIIYSNKDVILGLLGCADIELGLVISKDDIEQAKSVRKLLSFLTMKILSDGSNEFDNKIYELFADENNAYVRNAGLYAFLPSFIDNEQQRSKEKNTMVDLRTETLVVDEKIDGTVDVLSKHYIRKHLKYVYKAIHNNMVVSFWSYHNFTEDKLLLTAKVKSITVDYRMKNIPVAALNYVRVKS